MKPSTSGIPAIDAVFTTTSTPNGRQPGPSAGIRPGATGAVSRDLTFGLSRAGDAVMRCPLDERGERGARLRDSRCRRDDAGMPEARQRLAERLLMCGEA